MKIHRVNLTKRALAAMEPKERQLLLLLGHAANEINVLQKLILMIRHDDPAVKIVDYIEAGQVIILLRILIGKLHESWELLSKRFLSDKVLTKKYLPILPANAALSLKKIKNHFGKGSTLSRIRNNFSFHYCDKDNLADESFGFLPEAEPWEFCLHETCGNSFYYASELVISQAMIAIARQSHAASDVDDHQQMQQAFSSLCTDVREVARDITILFGVLIAEIIDSTIIDKVECSTLEIGPAPKLATCRIPFFVEESGLSSS